MVVLGQFNLGFIIARLGKDLYILDQVRQGVQAGVNIRMGTAFVLESQARSQLKPNT